MAMTRRDFVRGGVSAFTLGFAAPSFLTVDNFSNVLRQNAFPAIIAAGMDSSHVVRASRVSPAG